MSRRRASGLPLAVVAGGSAVVGCAVTLLATALVLHRYAALDGRARIALGGGLLVAICVGAGSALAASRFARSLRLLRADAVRRLQDPSAPVHAPTGIVSGPWTGTELAELARTLEALHLRVRMSDEVAERHRRTAETASAGMFELLSGLVAAEEGTRGQLSAELHDTVAQSLMLARSVLGSTSPAPDELERAAELVAEAEDQVRAVMARTRPPALRDGDLARAVTVLRDDLRTRYALEIELVWPATAYPLPLVTAVTVYRFFQEALLNVVKHAEVDDARAELAVDSDWVTAVVSDDGPGFDPGAVQPDRGRHVGLGLLRERARLAGGALEVVSRPGEGTTLTLRLPRAAHATGTLPGRRDSIAS
jgi:signal transduction histidine kinase